MQVKHANGCISDILPATDEPLSNLEHTKIQYTERTGRHLIAMINNGWAILDKQVAPWLKTPRHVLMYY